MRNFPGSVVAAALILAAVFLLTLPATATEASIDLRGPLLGDIYDQGDYGWCFAFAGSDVVSTVIGQRIAAWDAGAIYFTGMSNSSRFFRSIGSTVLNKNFNFNGGDYGGFLKILKRAGACPYYYDQTHFNAMKLAEAQNSLKTKAFSAKENCYIERIDISRVTFSSSHSPVELIAMLDHALEQNHAAGLTYRPRDILKAIHRKSTAAAKHASSVIGRKTVGGTVSYLIRNSWGRDCSVYRSDIACDSGNFWLTKEDLLNVATSVTVGELQ